MTNIAHKPNTTEGIAANNSTIIPMTSVNFLGRHEPVYAYNYTERIGTLSFKIVVSVG